jgi:hypothetical protein
MSELGMSSLSRRDFGVLAGGALSVMTLQNALAADDKSSEGKASPVELHLRSSLPGDLKTKVTGKQSYAEYAETWNLKKTALIICDMWDHHWCKSAERRVGELVGPMNAMVKRVRDRGGFIIHAPSSVVDFYKDTPQRKRAMEAPFVKTPIRLSDSPRWGTAWCWTDGTREGVLPIDDSDMGCDCQVKCAIEPPWTRQNKGIDLFPEDALTDNGQETWNLLSARDIDHVILCGVHLNMCVLGRPFGIRQMTKLGKRVVLVRDMTDTMYNPERPPGISHFDATRKMVEHVEKFWCPSIASSDLTGEPAFKFKGDA